MKEDKRKNNGGNKNAGRKPKADEEKATTRLLKALKYKYQKDGDENNIIQFLSEFLDTKEGLKFFAEHIIGKPKDKVEHSGEGLTAIVNLGTGIKPDEATK